tara:strand:+ start:116 stop:463 length:348 start_codon:yes stop_codon:yes gene_type:complete
VRFYENIFILLISSFDNGLFCLNKHNDNIGLNFFTFTIGGYTMPKYLIAYFTLRLNSKGVLHYYSFDDMTGLDSIIYFKSIDVGISRAGHRPPVARIVTGRIDASTTLEELEWLK